MILDTPKQWVDFLCKHNISPDQFLFLYIIYENDYASLYKYVHQNGGFDLDELGDLEDRGYLVNQDASARTSFADNYTETVEEKML